ncbi:MAG: metallophosphoesterase [Caulobacteraceae bacterium]
MRFIIVLQALWLLAASPALAQPLAAWTELTGKGAEARAVAGPDGCPKVSVDGRPATMAVRAQPSPEFPQVCALALPAGAASVLVDGQPLPLPAPARRIVILGDTGCRIKGLTAQACNDPKGWPFPEVARLAAARKPDLVIHVGDYYYRESPCPLKLKACAGSPSGDRWDTWEAEFFGPAAPLLAAAPWVFARGNHETCDRGGRGWFLLLDAGASTDACQAYATPFAVRTGDLNLFVVDSGESPDRGHDKADVAAMSAQLDRLGGALDLGRGWIITHRPVWGLVPIARLGPSAPFEVGLNFTEQDAVRGRALGGVQMMVSGHVHHFQALDFGPQRPAQLVVGTGGDIGEKADLARVYTERRVIDGLDAGVFSFSRYGYYLMEKDGEDWVGTFHDADDRVRARCRLHDRRLNCSE